MAWQAQRIAGEPIAQLVGSREFFGLDFEVTPHVLIPRPETELLVECALDTVQATPRPRILDLGTGSGAIAISIAHARPDACVVATDRSAAALDVARRNARRLLGGTEAEARITFHHGDWFDALGGNALSAMPARFDAIVSNPPYIAASDPHLDAGDLRFEPLDALTDHADGLSAIRTLIAGAAPWLAPGATLWLEHGYDQAEAVRALLTAHGFGTVRSMRDLAGIERVTGGSQCQCQ
jgi:release factor glutamine methyltransferase